MWRERLRKLSYYNCVCVHAFTSFIITEKGNRERMEINICYSPAGRSILGKTLPEVLDTARGRRPRAVLKTEGTVFPNTDRPRDGGMSLCVTLLLLRYSRLIFT